MKARMPRNLQMRRNILQFIDEYGHAHDRQPTVREIGAAVGLSSTSTTAGYLTRMARDGLLKKVDGKYHSYRIQDQAEHRGESA